MSSLLTTVAFRWPTKPRTSPLCDLERLTAFNMANAVRRQGQPVSTKSHCSPPLGDSEGSLRLCECGSPLGWFRNVV